VTLLPETPFLVIPEVSSGSREYLPIGWLEPPAVPSNLVRVLTGASLWHFGVLSSAMHMAWLRLAGGRLKSDYRYSIGMVYNTFPWPAAGARQREEIGRLAAGVLAARAGFLGRSLAGLYHPGAMPPELLRAHRALDLAIDRLYLSAPFDGDSARARHLLGLYERLRAAT